METGALINVKIFYNCNFDDDHSCDPHPTFSWQRQDITKDSVSSGYNFRQAFYSLNDNQSMDRLLVKYHGVRIKFNVVGQGRRFDGAAFTKTLGSGIALTAIATLITEFILRRCIPERSFYNSKREEVITVEQTKEWLRDNDQMIEEKYK